MFILLFSLPVHPTHPKIEKREQLCMLRQSLTRTSLRASSPHVPFGGYRSLNCHVRGARERRRENKGDFLTARFTGHSNWRALIAGPLSLPILLSPPTPPLTQG